MLLFLLELAIMIFFIMFGLRKGGALGIGLFSFVTLAIFIFGFGLPIGSAPTTAVLIIISIGIAGGALQASGGLDYLVHLAGKIIEKHPGAITFISPLIVFLFVFGIGTSNIALSLEPVIARTAMRARVRPERPLVSSVLAANLALVCSPAASSNAYIVALLAVSGVTLGSYLGIVLPTALLTVIALSVFMTFRGKKLIDDPEYIKRVKEGLISEEDIAVSSEEKVFDKKAKTSVVVFLVAVFAILFFGIFPQFKPTFEVGGELVELKGTDLVQIFMFLSAAINMTIGKVKAKDIFGANITTSAFGAAIAVLGPGLVGGTIFGAPQNATIVNDMIAPLLQSAPWLTAVVTMLLAMVVMSQTATSSIIFPLALSVGVSPAFIMAMVQAINTVFVIPAQPTILFANELDTTGTTKPKRFIIPGFFSIIVSIIIGVIWITVFNLK